MKKLNREEAIAFADAGEWKSWTPSQRGAFQLRQACLCMPWDAFHEGVEALLGRPVFTHEFACSQSLIDEAKGLIGRPTMEDILSQIPASKLIVVDMGEIK